MSTLSGRPVRVDNIRPDEEHVGLRDFEISFVRLIEKLTNGCSIEINYTGTSVLYKPGAIIGGVVSHDCGNERSISYFLEGLIALAPFAKKPFCVTLTGITNDPIDVSVDTIRTVTLPQLKRFGIDDGAELKVIPLASLIV
jgi:RNA 3'-terminal phosphate cyclase-like protein